MNMNMNMNMNMSLLLTVTTRPSKHHWDAIKIRLAPHPLPHQCALSTYSDRGTLMVTAESTRASCARCHTVIQPTRGLLAMQLTLACLAAPLLMSRVRSPRVQAISSLGYSAPKDDIYSVFSLLDTDGSGTIDYQ